MRPRATFLATPQGRRGTLQPQRFSTLPQRRWAMLPPGSLPAMLSYGEYWTSLTCALRISNQRACWTLEQGLAQLFGQHLRCTSASFSSLTCPDSVLSKDAKCFIKDLIHEEGRHPTRPPDESCGPLSRGRIFELFHVSCKKSRSRSASA